MLTIVLAENASEASTVWNPRGVDIGTYLDREPLIVQPQMPLQPFAFFNGWWLPPSHKEELGKFLATYECPLDLLREETQRRELQRYLQTNAPNDQGRLFGNELGESLRELEELGLQGKPLYNRFKKKTKGKERDLSVPKRALEEILRGGVVPLIKREERHRACHGGEIGWTPEQSIATHVPFKSVLTGDLANAYRNTNVQYVFDFFYNQARKNREGEARNIAGFLTLLTTIHYTETGLAGLPQGSPASTALFNRILRPIDEKFTEECAQRQWRYSRWIDDITISSPREEDPEEMAELLGIIRADFPIATHKVFFQQTHNPGCRIMGHIVTGDTIRKATEEDKKPEPYETNAWKTYNELDCDRIERELSQERGSPIIGHEDILF